MQQPTLVLVDVQKGFDDDLWGNRNNPQAESNIAKLLHQWRDLNWPVVHVQHCSVHSGSPLHPDHPGNAFKPEAEPQRGEAVFQKSVNSGFIGTNLESYLHENEATQLVIAGLTTDHCVSTTTRMAGNLGFDVILVSDATATFDKQGVAGELITADEVHRVNLASLNEEFCTVLDTQTTLERFIL